MSKERSEREKGRRGRNQEREVVRKCDYERERERRGFRERSREMRDEIRRRES